MASAAQPIDARIMGEDAYMKRIYEFAKRNNAVDLLHAMWWLRMGYDPYVGSKLGLYRWCCVLSLEFLFTDLLYPRGQFSACHRALARVLERRNIIMALICAETMDFTRRVPELIIEKARVMDKRAMYLMFRGFFKTTLISVAHQLQELLINPNARVLYISGSHDICTSILKDVKDHFLLNEKFRAVFPDYCPRPDGRGKLEWGTREEVTLVNRTVFGVREPTLKAAGPGTKLTGYHFHKIVFDDLINEDNCTNEEQLARAEEMLRHMYPLFDRPADPYYEFVGTPYHYGDVYQKLKGQHADESGNLDVNVYDPGSDRWVIHRKKVA